MNTIEQFVTEHFHEAHALLWIALTILIVSALWPMIRNEWRGHKCREHDYKLADEQYDNIKVLREYARVGCQKCGHHKAVKRALPMPMSTIRMFIQAHEVNPELLNKKAFKAMCIHHTITHPMFSLGQKPPEPPTTNNGSHTTH